MIALDWLLAVGGGFAGGVIAMLLLQHTCHCLELVTRYEADADEWGER